MDNIKGASSPLLADGWGGDVVQRCQREHCTLNEIEGKLVNKLQNK